MGVAQHSVDRNRPLKQAVKIRLAVACIGIADLGHIFRIDSEQRTDLLVPFQFKNVKKLCAGSIGIICLVRPAARQLVYYPAVDGAVADFSFFCLLSGSLHMFQDPRDLRRREIRRQVHPRPSSDVLCLTFFLHPLTDIHRTGTLPYNGMAHGFSRHPVPRKGSLTLIADSHPHDFTPVNVLRQPCHDIDHIGINL